jgi:hypothetical protein
LLPFSELHSLERVQTIVLYRAAYGLLNITYGIIKGNQVWLGRWPQWCRYKVAKMLFLPLLSDFRHLKRWRIFLETPTLVFIHPITVFFYKRFEDLFSKVGGLDFDTFLDQKQQKIADLKVTMTLPSLWKHWTVHKLPGISTQATDYTFIFNTQATTQATEYYTGHWVHLNFTFIFNVHPLFYAKQRFVKNTKFLISILPCWLRRVLLLNGRSAFWF